MNSEQEPDNIIREQLAELLKGGFAPNVILLREFHFDKTGIIMPGLHFSAWILLGHMRARQTKLLNFMLNPEQNHAVWEEAVWPENPAPANEQEWQEAITDFEHELSQMVRLVLDTEIDLFKIHINGKTLSHAALIALHHNGYHIGQLKTIGRQLGVW